MKGYTPTIGCESKKEAEYIAKKISYKTRIRFGCFVSDVSDWTIFIPTCVAQKVDPHRLVDFKHEHRGRFKK